MMYERLITYQRQAEEILGPAICKITRATNNLPLQLTLEDLRHESDLFVRKWDAPQVSERRLSQVVEEAEKELLSVTLLAKLERPTPNVLK